MPATLHLTREVVFLELRGGTFDVVVDGERVGSIELRHTFETEIAPGPHALQVRRGRYSSRICTFEASEDEFVNFRCHGANLWPIWLASYAVPTLGITLRRD